MEAARRLTGMRPRKVAGEWVYPHSADELAAAHLQTVAHYIQMRRHTVHNNVRDRTVLKECRRAERRRGTPPRLFWTEQDMTEPERREYGAAREGSAILPLASRARVAPQARPTIAVEERPRGPMPAADPRLEEAWRNAHIND